MGKKKKDEYDDIYEEDFAIGFKYTDGQLEAKTEVLSAPDMSLGVTNKTDDSPDDILQMAVYCSQCGAFMKYVKGDNWMGDYVCSTCRASVNEADVINQMNRNSSGIFDDWNDVYGDN